MRVLLLVVVVLLLIGACSSRQVPPADADHVAQLQEMNREAWHGDE